MNSIKKSNAYWHAVFSKFEKSGQSIKNFCDMQKISIDQFMYWRKKLILQPKKQTNKKTESIENRLQEIKIQSIKSQPVLQQQERDTKPIQITFPNDITLSLPNQISTKYLLSAITELRKIIC